MPPNQAISVTLCIRPLGIREPDSQGNGSVTQQLWAGGGAMARVRGREILDVRFGAAR